MASPNRPVRTLALATVALLGLPLAPAAQADATHYSSLPELQEATVVSTTATEQSSDSSPAGTTVSYRFDEPVATVAPEPAEFLVYDTQGVASAASDVSVEDDTVTALFPAVDTAEESAALSLAVVEADAVHGSVGDANPIGAVGVTRRWTSKVRGPRGCLLTTGDTPLRHVGSHTVVDFTFSSCGDGDTTVDPHGFGLQMVDGRSIEGTRVRYRSADHLSVRISFPGRIARANIGRVTVDAGAMSYEYISGGSDDHDYEANPLLVQDSGGVTNPEGSHWAY